MKYNDHIANHDKFAKEYDSQAKEFSSYGPDALFGMCYEYVKPGEKLLDLGIGTGLSSINFARTGLVITGLDGSKEMLKECEKKNFTAELLQYDIMNTPVLFPDGTFDHVICCGVFHFFADITPLISDSFRMLKQNGIFAFTIAIPTVAEKEEFNKNDPDYISLPTAWGIPVYKHFDHYIQTVAGSINAQILKEQKLLVKGGKDESDDILFKVIVMQKCIS